MLKKGKRKIIFQTARKMTASQKKLMADFVKDGDLLKEKINPEIKFERVYIHTLSQLLPTKFSS